MTDAARQKRRRSREAQGLAVYPVEVGGAILDGLHMAGLIREAELADRDAVASALARALADWADLSLSSRVTAIALGHPYDATRKDRT